MSQIEILSSGPARVATEADGFDGEWLCKVIAKVTRWESHPDPTRSWECEDEEHILVIFNEDGVPVDWEDVEPSTPQSVK